MKRLPRLAGLTLLGLCALPAAAATIRTIAGTGAKGFSGDGGPATQAQFDGPSGMALGPDGALYVCDTNNERIRRIAADGIVTTVAGNGTAGWSGDGGPATAASLHEPWELRFDSAGNLLWVERLSAVVRERDAKTGIIRTVAGNGQSGFSGDGGPATQAELHEPHSLALDPQGNLFICDIHNQRVRRVDHVTGIITTFAGNGQRRPIAEGAARAGTALSGPRAAAFDADGQLWLVLRDGNQLLRFGSDGRIHVVAGTGKKGASGDGGPALAATFAGPKGLAIAPGGDVLIADTDNFAIRALDPRTGIITRIAGTGQKGDGPDGDPLACALNRPHGILAGPKGVIYIGDTDGNRVREVDP